MITIEELRARGKRIESPVLAEGEVTGHAHRLETMEGVERYELDGKGFLAITAEGGISISHEDHGEGLIPPGVYEERIDREFDYAQHMSRRVVD